MFIPKQLRTTIYGHLFREGVLVAQKNFHPKAMHPDLTKIPNLVVYKTMQSLVSKGYLKEQFNWRHHYWTLTDEGIEYLSAVLNLPANVVPTTVIQKPRPGASIRGSTRP
uniref:Plectin/eS10 N-terminal domain-containing protein n=1 Tax=Anopheles farauti TaxID=69004 RepID=A0A182Q0F7_9DIPT